MSVAIGKLRNVFVVPRDEPRPAELCARLQASVGRSAAEALDRAFDRMLDPLDPSVWVIRRLRLSFPLGGGIEGDVAVRSWALCISQGIAQVLARGADGENILRFPSRAAYWAWFLRDIAHGLASRWWYNAFDSLRSLPAGAAVAAALSREPECAEAVFCELDKLGMLGEVVELLSEAQAVAVLELLAAHGGAAQAEAIESCAETALAMPLPARRKPGQRRLLLYLRTRLRRATLEPASVRGAVERIVEMEERLGSLPSAEARLESLRGGDRAVEEFVRECSRDSEAARILASSLGRETLVRLMERALRAPLSENQVFPGGHFLTEFGGWYLLLPVYLSLGIEEMLAERGLAAAPVRWRLARMCLGPRGRAADPDDPGLLWACGLERAPMSPEVPMLMSEALRTWMGEEGAIPEGDPQYFGSNGTELSWAPVAATILNRFARRLPGFAESSPAHLDWNFFEGRASVWLEGNDARVHLLPRPLDIVMRMAAMDGESYTISWRNDARVTIHLG